jgi:hypothetical protein
MTQSEILHQSVMRQILARIQDTSYVLNHLLSIYGNQLSSAQIAHAETFSKNIDELLTRYGESFSTDNVLNTHTTVDDTVLSFREAVEKQMQKQLNASE